LTPNFFINFEHNDLSGHSFARKCVGNKLHRAAISPANFSVDLIGKKLKLENGFFGMAKLTLNWPSLNSPYSLSSFWIVSCFLKFRSAFSFSSACRFWRSSSFSAVGVLKIIFFKCVCEAKIENWRFKENIDKNTWAIIIFFTGSFQNDVNFRF